MIQKPIYRIGFLILFFVVLWGFYDLNAQCPMCKMAVESNMKQGGSAGRGLNNGILYMLSMPYVLVGVIGYLWWKNKAGTRKE